jgi:hypothetical protein
MGAKLHWSKGKQPRSQSKVPKSPAFGGALRLWRSGTLSVKGGIVTYTTRRLA